MRFQLAALVIATRGDAPVPSRSPPAAGPTPAPLSLTQTASEESLRVVTAANTPALRALLDVDEYCNASVAQFAAAYAGRTGRFDGSVSAINVYGDSADIGLAAGDDGMVSTDGRAFRGTGIDADRPRPANLVVVDGSYRITAEVGAFDPMPCLLGLRPTRVVAR